MAIRIINQLKVKRLLSDLSSSDCDEKELRNKNIIKFRTLADQLEHAENLNESLNREFDSIKLILQEKEREIKLLKDFDRIELAEQNKLISTIDHLKMNLASEQKQFSLKEACLRDEILNYKNLCEEQQNILESHQVIIHLIQILNNVFIVSLFTRIKEF